MPTVIGTIPNAVRLDEGGALKVGDTRVSLDAVVYAFNNGADAAEIQRDYDSMSLAEVHAAIAYYLHNIAKIDSYIAKQEIRRGKISKDLKKSSKQEMS